MESSPGEGRRAHSLAGGGATGNCPASCWRRRLLRPRPMLASRLAVAYGSEQHENANNIINLNNHQQQQQDQQERNNTCETSSNPANSRLINSTPVGSCPTSGRWSRAPNDQSVSSWITSSINSTTNSINHLPYINSTNKKRRRRSHLYKNNHHDYNITMLPFSSRPRRASSRSSSMFTSQIKQLITSLMLIIISTTLTVNFVASLQQSNNQVNLFNQNSNANNNQLVPTPNWISQAERNLNFGPSNNPTVESQLDHFGSRLGAQVAGVAVGSLPTALEAGEQPQASAEAAPAAPYDPTSGLFANRQGQLADDPTAQFQQRRPPRQPAPSPANNNNLNRQQLQQPRQRQQLPVGPPLQAAPSQPQPQAAQFQRLRAPSGVEQFPRPIGAAGQQQPFPAANGQQQQTRQQQQQNNQLPLNLPTLSAFDLSSLANLASNPGASATQQANNNQQAGPTNNAAFNQMQPTFRRLPPQPPNQQSGQQQQQRANNNNNNNNMFDGLNRAQQQVPNMQQQQPQANANNLLGNNAASPTELPFIRQVFRPSESNADLVNANNELSRATSVSSGRPTPPPLFVPGRQQAPLSNVRQQSNARPLLESGFSPIRPSSESVFFEPNQRQQSNRQPLQTNRQPLAATQAPSARPTVASTTVTNVDQARARPAVRRPSQRPQVPSVTNMPPSSTFPSATSSLNLPARQQQRVSPVPAGTNDVIRLASSAIQTINDGLAALTSGQLGTTTSSPATVPTFATGSSQPSLEPQTLPPSSSQTDSPSSTTGTVSSSTTTEGTAPATTTSEESPSRRNAAPLPLRTSANIFSLTSAATLSPSSFSPALPINAAVAASGGRRRIPVRANSQSLSSQRQQQQQSPITTTTTMASGQPFSTPMGPVTTPLSTSADTQPPPPPTTTTTGNSRSQPTSVSVRRPEIEEFYETIGNGFSSSSLNSIDRFSAPSRQQQPPASSAPTTTSSSSSSSAESAEEDSSSRQPPFTTTPAADLYGSRLNAAAEQPASGGSLQSDVQAQRQPQLKPVEPPVPASRVQASEPTEATNNNNPVLVPVTYITTLTYLTTVLHGTHTLETSHESVERSTKLATLNAQLMDQIEHKLPLIEPTATVSLSSRTKGRGTTLINLKSAVSAYNQELVEALGTGGPTVAQPQPQVEPTSVAAPAPVQTVSADQASSSSVQQVPFKRQRPLNQQRVGPRPSRTIELAELEGAKKSLLTEYVYSYTIRPISESTAGESPQQQVAATSVRSELVQGTSVDDAELANQLQLHAAGGSSPGGGANVIDSNGLLRLEPANEFASALNLGSTIGRDSPSMLTEVNLNVATYVSFEGISNAFVDVVRPSRLASPVASSSGGQPAAGGRPLGSQLDTSFNVHLTLGNALGHLHLPSAQQTPALDPLVRPTSKSDDLLRQPQATAGGQQPPPSQSSEVQQNQQSSRSQASSLARSQLRSRVASSRFRSGPLQTLQPNRAANGSPSSPSNVSVSPVLSSAPASSSSGESLASSGGRRLSNKSRLARPQLKPTSESAATSELAQSSSSPANIASGTSLAAPTRSSKPRFVVVTRTGQFGIRASAISSLAAAAASGSQSDAGSIEPTSVPTVRVSSRFSKPNRFRGASQSIQVTRVPPEQLASSSSIISPSQVAAAPAVTSSVAVPVTTQASSSTSPTSDQTSAGSSTSTSTSPTTDNEPQSNRLAAANEPAVSSATPADSLLGGAVKLDPSQSIVVTYFTTTTHTIPFTLNSETVFTTLEETNSRIATEYMRDLGGQFVEATPVVSAPMASTTLNSQSPPPMTTTGPSTGGAESTTSNGEQSGPTITTQASQQEQQQQQQQPPANRLQSSIEPSFVVSLNTRTYFTTFTAFTTYTLASDSISVKSSESTTSSIVTETVTSRLDADIPMTTISPQLTRLPDTQTSLVMSPIDNIQSRTTAEIEPTMTTQTVLSTMTYFGTLYNGTQTSLTPIVDVSTQLVTLSSPAFNVNSDLLSSPTVTTAVESTQVATDPSNQQTNVNIQSVSPASPSAAVDPQRELITRTKSMYTTLTHFITFYSGTKTQLSTIQEISPTVVTEFIDKTLFEQQQQRSAASESSVTQMIVPTQAPIDSSGMIQATQTLTSPADQTLSSVTANMEQSPSSSETSSGSASSSTISTSSTTTTTSTSTSSEQPETTPAPKAKGELDSVQVNRPEGPGNAENQSSSQPGDPESEQGKVLASSADGRDTGENRQSPDGSSNTNIIELSDLIASNSSQSGRVALAGNLGNAIKDIVQLLAGNKTNTLSPLTTLGQQQQPTTMSDFGSSSTGSSESAISEQPPTTTTSTPAATSTTAKAISKPPTRVFGNKSREQSQLASQMVQGSISSPSVDATMVVSSAASSVLSNVRATPELATASIRERNNQQQQQPAATIFFGDDGGDERKKAIKTVWPGAQSTIFVTSIESSTRSLIVTTTKVYYTRDSPLTITSSLTSVIAPRTFVSTIMGTRTLVNQLNGPTASVSLAQTPQVNESTSKRQSTTPGPSRQDSQAASHRLSVQQKVQKQQAQAEQQQKRQQQQQEMILKQQKAKQVAAAAAAAPKSPELPASNINQCQPACKASQNEICKFTPTLETSGAQGTFACACRPGYYMTLNQVGQRQCQEVQSYVILLRLLQIGDQQVSFKRELQSRSSPEFKQYAHIVKDHVKRAYMTSELTRDRFVGADIISFARVSPSLANSSSSPGSALALASQQPLVSSVGKPINLTSQLLDPLNSGVIVNMTIYLQPPNGSNEIQIDESMLKEELTKKLNMRQAAALAAAAAAVASGQSPVQVASATAAPSLEQQAPDATNTTSGQSNSSQVQQDEFLPNPNALFLADVEQVHDLDECASPTLNDCHEGAVCINEPGSYRCDCREYPDLNPLNPGRQCAAELKSCDFCNNRGDCLRVPNTMTFNSTSGPTARPQFSTICQCNRIYLGRRCEFNGLLLATLLPIGAILLIISVCLVIYLCRRWRKRSALHKGFRNIGTFGPNLIGGTIDRKAMLESSSESSDTHQRSHGHQHHHAHHHLRAAAAAAAANGIYDTHGGIPSEPCSSNDSSPGQMVRSQLVDGGLLQAGPGHSAASAYQLASPAVGQSQQQPSLSPYCNSIPPQIVIPRARHNQVNYAVHRGQVYMW